MKEIQKYLLNDFGIESEILPLQKVEKEKLPLYLKGNYDLHYSFILNQKVIWAKFNVKDNFTPEQLKKQGEQLKHFLQSTTIFVFDRIESWERKRLIEKKVAFVQPNKQIYVPEILLQLNDVLGNVSREKKTVSENLSYTAQLTILYHIEITSLEKKSFQEIAEVLEYSAMTASRVIKELHSFDLISVEGGKEKSIKFKEKGRDLWETTLPLLNSPVRDIWFTDQLINDDHFRIAGDNALSVYTMISNSNLPNYAIGKDEFRSLKTLGSLKKLDKKNGNYRIEVWYYNPVLLSNKKEVDKLSLYLSLKDDKDERVLGALNELLNEIQW